MQYILLVQLFQMVLLVSRSLAGPHEKRLLNDLLKSYNPLERPVEIDNQPLTVIFGMTLQQIIDVDEKNQILTINIWLNMAWNDYNLRWNKTEYGNVSEVRLPPSKIWKPDILMYNSADEDIDSTYHTNIIVASSGDCLWVPPGLFLSTCKIDITWFPFDDQKCEMKFGSWTYTKDGIDLQLAGTTGDTSTFMTNGEWELIGVPGERGVKTYQCCPEQYPHVTFTIHIRRRTLYYVFNLIIPCVLISSMALLSFTLPPDAGEKISLGVTILLSLTVFLLLVAETMPPTSDAVPLIGMYFACIMLMCSLSVVFTVLVLNFHHRSPDTSHDMPRWVKKGVCEWLAWLLRMKQPGKDNCRSRVMGRMRDLELRERSSRSLLANVLDIDDDLCRIHNHTPPNQTPFNESNNVRHDYNCPRPAHERSLPSVFREILDEVRLLSDKIRKDEMYQSQCSDWKFAAIVVDRFCLWMFTIFTTVSTLAILLSSPNVFS